MLKLVEELVVVPPEERLSPLLIPNKSTSELTTGTTTNTCVCTTCYHYGFIYQSSEIYDGLAAVYDYAPYGVLLKNYEAKLGRFG